MIKLKKSYKDITVGQYDSIQKLIKSEQPSAVELISIVYDIPKKELLKLPVSEYTLMDTSIAFLVDNTSHYRVVNYIKINGVEFKVNSNIMDLTAGQFIDLNNYLRDPNHKLVDILSTLLVRKELKYYDSDIASKDKVIINQLDADTGMGILSFLLVVCNTSFSLMMKALQRMKPLRNNPKMEKYLQKLADLSKVSDGLLLSPKLAKN